MFNEDIINVWQDYNEYLNIWINKYVKYKIIILKMIIKIKLLFNDKSKQI